MSAPQLLYGQRDPATLPGADTVLDLNATEPLVIADAEIFYSLFELPMSVAEQMLPASLHPSIPALLGVTFVRADDGPLGAFDLAYVGVACRTGIKPRHLIQSAFCSSTKALDFFSSRYGFACAPADINCHETYDRVRGDVSIDGNTILDITITDYIPLLGAGATIKYSPPLNSCSIAGTAALAQFEATYEFKRVLRGKPQAVCFAGESLGGKRLHPTHPVAGSHAIVDWHLLPVRFALDPGLPAEAGGARKIQR